MRSKFKVRLVWPARLELYSDCAFTAIARIDRMGQTRPTEGTYSGTAVGVAHTHVVCD